MGKKDDLSSSGYAGLAGAVLLDGLLSKDMSWLRERGGLADWLCTWFGLDTGRDLMRSLGGRWVSGVRNDTNSFLAVSGRNKRVAR